MTFLIAILALFMGSVLGLLGGGGSILTLPILVYAAGLPPGQAIASSLVVVGMTSAVSAASHARKGAIELRIGLIFGAVAMLGAYVGGRIAAFVPGWLLLGLFAGLMIFTSLRMLSGKKKGSSLKTAGAQSRNNGALATKGLFVGIITGLIGAGGGFLVVPALVMLGGLPMHKAVGTSLLIIAMNSVAGVLGHLAYIDINWTLTGAVTAFGVLGSVIGAQFAAKIPADTLRTIFAWFVLIMGAFILVSTLLSW